MPAIQTAWTGTIGPSGDTAGARDTATIQAALTAGGTATLARGHFWISTALVMTAGATLRGAGPDATTITQVTAAANGVTGIDTSFAEVSDLRLTGPGYATGTGYGIRLAKSVNADIGHVTLRDVWLDQWGNHCIYGSTMAVSRFDHVLVQDFGADGFRFDGPSNTALTFDSCYADCTSGARAGAGYQIGNGLYCSFSGCASDSNFWAYAAIGCSGVAWQGCGAESCTNDQWVMQGGSGNTITGCWTLSNNHVGVNLSSGETLLSVTGFNESAPGGSAVASVKTVAGTSAVVTNLDAVTAASYAAGTAYVITPTGAAAH